MERRVLLGPISHVFEPSNARRSGWNRTFAEISRRRWSGCGSRRCSRRIGRRRKSRQRETREASSSRIHVVQDSHSGRREHSAAEPQPKHFGLRREARAPRRFRPRVAPSHITARVVRSKAVSPLRFATAVRKSSRRARVAEVSFPLRPWRTLREAWSSHLHGFDPCHRSTTRDAPRGCEMSRQRTETRVPQPRTSRRAVEISRQRLEHDDPATEILQQRTEWRRQTVRCLARNQSCLTRGHPQASRKGSKHSQGARVRSESLPVRWRQL